MRLLEGRRLVSLSDSLYKEAKTATEKAASTATPVSPGVRWEKDGQTLTTRPSDTPDVDWSEQLSSWGLNPDEWTVIGNPRISVWEAQAGGGEVIQMHAWKAQLHRIGSDGDTPYIAQATPVEIKVPARPAEVEIDGWKTAVILPDAQRPTQDEDAVDVSLQVLEAAEHIYGVDDIIHLGDDLDLPDLGRHRSAPETCGKINLAVQQQYRTLAYERALCPTARISWLAGNHEARLTNWLVDNAPQLLALQRPDMDSEDPVLSIPFLCRLAELDVDYLDPYPEAELWLNDHLRCIHGTITKSGRGQTAAAYLAQGNVSTIYGHIHRAELLWQTRHTRHGARTYMAGSPGTLCRIDGQVPSSRSGINYRGQQGGTTTEDWQQGMWIVRYQPDGGQWFTIEPVNIWAGWGTWRGRTFLSTISEPETA